MHVTVGNAIQHADVSFACVRHMGYVRAAKCARAHKTLLSDEWFCICFPRLPLCLLYKSYVTCMEV